MSEFDKLIPIDSVLDQERRNKQALLILLDAQRERKDHLLGLTVRMGTTRSYIASIPLDWMAQRVRFATELPLFKDHIDPKTGKVRLDRETAAIVQQREPDWRRQYPMTLYLAKRRTHKFPPVLLVATQPWVDNPKDDKWDHDGRALRDSFNAQSLDSIGEYVDLHLAEEDVLYAIDGQHRLMAIKGLTELLNTGRLFARDRDSKQLAAFITVDEIVDQSKGEISRAALQQLLAERIGVEIIPAVMKGETRMEAVRRVRSIFVHVNRTAVPLTKGEIALLDEDDGFAVVARLATYNHPLLKDRVHLKKGQLNVAASELTTLETTVSMAREYLGQFKEFGSWKPDTRTEMAARPEEESLDKGYELFNELLTTLGTIPSLNRVLQGGNPGDIREKEANALFRPLAQVALVEALGTLVVDRQRKLSTLVSMIGHQEAAGLLSYTDPKSPLYGVIYDPTSGTMARNDSARKLATRLLIHVLGGGTPDDASYKELRSDFAEARIVDRENNLAVDLKGNRVTPDKVDLPTPW